MIINVFLVQDGIRFYCCGARVYPVQCACVCAAMDSETTGLTDSETEPCSAAMGGFPLLSEIGGGDEWISPPPSPRPSSGDEGVCTDRRVVAKMVRVDCSGFWSACTLTHSHAVADVFFFSQARMYLDTAKRRAIVKRKKSAVQARKRAAKKGPVRMPSHMADIECSEEDQAQSNSDSGSSSEAFQAEVDAERTQRLEQWSRVHNSAASSNATNERSGRGQRRRGAHAHSSGSDCTDNEDVEEVCACVCARV